MLPRSPRKRHTEWYRAGATGGVEQYQADVSSYRDPASGQRNNSLALEDRAMGQFTHGIITAVTPYCHSYHVACHGETLPITCVVLAPTSLDVMSAKWSTTLTVMTEVLVFKPIWSSIGLIIGVIPSANPHPLLQLPDFFVPLAGSGFRWDDVFTTAAVRDGTGVLNCSAGRPADGLPGDWSIINEMGVGALIGRTMATMRASDIARLDFFYIDNLVRLFSQNYEHFAAGYERTIKDDEGEISELEMLTPYPWEAMGLSGPGLPSLTTHEYEWTKGETNFAKEPVMPRQTGIFRLLRMRGYLGDLERTIVAAPTPVGSSVRELAQGASEPATDNGLFEQTIGSDGSYTLRSAKQVVLAKHCLIPVPARRRLEHEVGGDSSLADGGYRASGVFGNGPDHNKREWLWADSSPAFRGAEWLDWWTYHSNWYNLMTVAKHEKDWYLPQARDVSLGSIHGQDRESVYSFGAAFEAPLPERTTLQVDHRGSVSYYKSHSSLALLDDGSIILSDGYGGQIKMSGGNIYISCPGDIFFQPGRSSITWAPGDIVSRAGRSVDISAAQNDVRIKAERNLHMLSGNSGVGGTLLENKAQGAAFSFENVVGENVVSSGIALKSATAPILAMGDQIYLKGLNSSEITLDASGGTGSILLFGSTVLAAVTNAMTIAAGINVQEDEESEVLHTFSATGVVLDSAVTVTGQAAVLGNLIVDGAVVASGAVAGSTAPFIGGVPDDFQDRLRDFSDRLTDYEDVFNLTLTAIFEQFFGDKTKWGSAEFARNLAFSFRSDQQYRSTDMKLWEMPWQQLMRLGNSGARAWAEPFVTLPDGTKTFPHPGHTTWAVDRRFGRVNLRFYDADERRPRDRPYNLNIGATPDVVTFDDGYVVTSQ